MRGAGVLLGLALAGCRLEPTAAGTAAPGVVDTIEVVRVPAQTQDGQPAGPLFVGPAGLAVPVAGVGPDDLVDTFGDARSEGRVHDAIDILAPRGTPVVAAAAGTVGRLFASERGGLTVYVLDGQIVFYYAHLDAYAPGLAAGRRIARGEVLGTVGSTGNASPEAPHLHFAVWRAESAASFWDGEAVNPYPLLTGR